MTNLENKGIIKTRLSLQLGLCSRSKSPIAILLDSQGDGKAFPLTFLWGSFEL